MDPELLDILACPVCLADLEMREERLHCTRQACGCIYPVDDGIPVTLIDEAEKPCPDCDAEREWIRSEEHLHCPGCGSELEARRG